MAVETTRVVASTQWDGSWPTAHAMPLVNVFRADEVRPSLPHDEAMRNAPAKANRS